MSFQIDISLMNLEDFGLFVKVYVCIFLNFHKLNFVWNLSNPFDFIPIPIHSTRIRFLNRLHGLSVCVFRSSAKVCLITSFLLRSIESAIYAFVFSDSFVYS